MNYYHADVLVDALEGVLRVSTAVDVVTSTVIFTVDDASKLLKGDTISVTHGATTISTTITAIDRETQKLTVDTAVTGVAHGDAVAYSLPHQIYSYKEIERDAPAKLVRPFVAVTVPSQARISNLPRGSSPDAIITDTTRLAIYVETPFNVKSGTSVTGGFDTLHHPAVRHLRRFFRSNQALDIPAALNTVWRSGTVGMRLEDLPELPARRREDGEGHVFFVTMWDFSTLQGG